MKEIYRPELTVKSKAAAIVQDARAYQQLRDVAARADANEGIRQGLDDANQGNVQPAREFFDAFEAKTGADLVNLTRRAQRDPAQLYSEINAGTSDSALICHRGLRKAIPHPGGRATPGSVPGP